jgi:anthranilate phosphoribosyltransferase
MQKFKEIINSLRLDSLLNDKDSYEAFSLIADGKINNDEIKEFLLLINEKGIDEALLYGAAKSLNERSIKLESPKDAIDVCGTGGDNSNSLNISTAVAIIIASMGIPVAKHGNKAVSSNSGSADIFSELGIDINKSKEESEDSLKNNNLAFIFAPLYHPALKNVAIARKELGVRTIFNFLGPLLNPAQTKYQLIGCSDQKVAKIMLNVCTRLKKERCLVVTGLDGMDEISISSDTLINKIDDNGSAITQTFNPQDYGVKKRSIKLIEGKDPKYNSLKLIDLLKGNIKDEKSQAYFDIVTLNCAAALIVSGKFTDFNEAMKSTQTQIKSGKSYNFLLSLS